MSHPCARFVATAVWMLAVGALPMSASCSAGDGGGPVDDAADELRRRRHYDAGADASVGPTPLPDAEAPTPPTATTPPPDTGTLTPCDQTLKAGAELAAAVMAAAAGTTICLEAGDYGEVTLTNVVKASDVTVRSASGLAASTSLRLRGSRHLRFQNLTIRGMDMWQVGNKNVTVAGSAFTDQLLVTGGTADTNVVIDRNTFDGINVCADCYEGRFQLYDGLGVRVTNNHFGKAGESDGIQIGGSGAVIGPGNVFDGIVQANYSRHVDSIQLYGQSNTTITGNYFVNNDIQIMAPDGGKNEIIVGNVFIGRQPGVGGIQLGSHIGDTFAHNTVKDLAVGMDKKVENTTKSQNATVHDNLMISARFSTKDSGGTESCVNCTFDHNMFTSASDARGTTTIVGTPAFVGGAGPTTWAGWQLTVASPGHLAASDGKDVGAIAFGSP